jgi:hypothetical protein
MDTGEHDRHDAIAQQWLLVNVDAGGSSASVFDAWRRLRALGAHYLQPSVCLLPERPDTRTAVDRVVTRVQRAGGTARVFPIGIREVANEDDVVAAFSAERSDEYARVVERTGAFVAEISAEREHRRASYPAVEESEVVLRQLQRWLASIRKRDYFDAPGYERARDAVATCERTLADFAADAFAAELHPANEDSADAPRRVRLRSPGDPA